MEFELTALPAYCTSCGHVFLSDNFIKFEGHFTADLQNNYVSCQRCGKQAKIADGKFDILNDTVTLLTGPTITLAVMRQLESVAKQLAAKEISNEQAIQQTNKISPEFSPVFERAVDRGATALGLIIAILAMYIAYNSSEQSSAENQQIIEQLTKQTQILQKPFEQGQPNNHTKNNAKPSKVEILKKLSTIKMKSKRRAKVRKTRRHELRKHRQQFNSYPSHH